MRRQDHKSRGQEQSSVETRSKATLLPQIIETDQSTVGKLLSGTCYSAEDMRRCARALLETHGYADHKAHLGVFENVDELCEAWPKLQRPIFVIFSQSKQKWSLLHNHWSNKVSYKNPTGTIDNDLKDLFGDGVEFVANTSKDLDDDSYYGPITLRNLKLVLMSKEKIDFASTQFCTQKDVSGSKRNAVRQLTCEIANNVKFTAELQRFIDELPLDLSIVTANYKKVLEEETQKDEDAIDHQRIEQARKKCMDVSKIEEVTKRYRFQERDKEFQLKIQNQFPKETKKFQDILEVLEHLEVDDDLRAALASMSQLLGINVEKMQAFYEQKLVKPVEVQEEKLELEDIAVISANF